MKRSICIVLAITLVILMSGCAFPVELLEKILPPMVQNEAQTVAPPDCILPPDTNEPDMTVPETEEPVFQETAPTADPAEAADTLMKKLEGHWVCWYDGAYIFSFDFENNMIVTGFYQSEAMGYKIKSVTPGADNVLVFFTYLPESDENFGLDYEGGDYVFTVIVGDGECSISCNGGAPLTYQFAGMTYEELYAYCDQFYR